MNRETSFETNMKWLLIGFAGLSGICQLILLFTEFSFFKSAGMLFNGLYHLVGALCSVLIVMLFLKKKEDKEVYSGYAIGLLSLLGFVVDICLLVKYISETKNTDGLQVWLIILIVILAIFEIVYAVVFVKYGLDKVTSILPLLLTVVFVILKGCVYNTVDSRFKTYAYNTVDKSIFTVWMFIFLFSFFAMVVCIVLYLDSGFLQEVLHNPKELFSKKTLFGTYTNLYMKDEKSNAPIPQPAPAVKSEPVPQQQPVVNAMSEPGPEPVFQSESTPQSESIRQFEPIPQSTSSPLFEPILQSTSSPASEPIPQSEPSSVSVPIPQPETVPQSTVVSKPSPVNQAGSVYSEQLNSAVNTNQPSLEVNKGNGQKKKHHKLIITIIISVVLISVGSIVMISILGNKSEKDSGKENPLTSDGTTEEINHVDVSLQKAKEAYALLTQSEKTVDAIGAGISGAWGYAIEQKSDSYPTCMSLSKVCGLTETEVESALKKYRENDLRIHSYQDKWILSDFQKVLEFLIKYGYTPYYEIVDKNLASAKSLIQAVDKNEAYYTDLVDYYTAVSNYLEFCKSPTGNYQSVGTTRNEYENTMSTSRSKLSFYLE